MSRGAAIARFWLRLVCFLLLLAVVLGYIAYVLTPKYDYGICSMTNLYRQDEDTVDVLVLGTSVAYAGVNTNVLWEEHGIAAYDLCGAEQPFWISYFYLEEALKTQSPRLILVDAKAAIYQQDHTNPGRTILSTYGIRDPLTRLRAIAACVPMEDVPGYALAFPQLHSFYPNVTAESFTLPPDNGGRGADWKGYIESTDVERHQRPSLVRTDTQKPLHPRQKEYFEKMLDLAAERDIPVLVAALPTPDYAFDHMYYNALQAVAEEHGALWVDYNDPDRRYGLLYASDFADWQHLNVKGSVTLSRQLGKDLDAWFDLPDRRGDAAYESYQRCADAWFGQYPQYRWRDDA